MKNKKTAWIPAIIAIAAALALIAYFIFARSAQEGGPGGGRGGMPPDGLRRPPGEGGAREAGDWMTTLGTIAVFLGAASFSWFWFKKKMRSASSIVRAVGKLLFKAHRWLGWAALILIAIHGIYFLLTKSHDSKIYTGLASAAILLALAGYGLFIRKVRNKAVRIAHRSLGVVWAPVLLLHAGGSAIMAILACLAAGGLVWVLERMAQRTEAAASSRPR